MIFIFILWLDRKQIGIGTILNMVLVGFEIQWFTTIYHQLFGYRTTFLIVAADTLIGLTLFTLGASLYMAPDLGAAPYDAIAPIITQRTKLSYRELLESHKTFYSWSLPLLQAVLSALVRSSLPSSLVHLFHGGTITYQTQWLRRLTTPLSLRKNVIKTLPLCFCRTSVSVLITLSITRCKRLKRCVTICLNTQLLI